MDQITNQSKINYDYKIDPSGASASKEVISNIVNTNLVSPLLQIVLTVDKTYATVNDILTYTVKVTNAGNILLSDTILKNTMPTGLSFVAGSVKVNGTTEPTYDITTGINLGQMILLASKTITFQAKVTTLPTPNTITNKVSSTFSYIVGSIISGVMESNPVTTTVNVTSVSVVKSANMSDVEVGDEITYTIVVKNNGNVDATNITFTDVLEAHLTFVEGSVTVNGTAHPTYHPNTGFVLPNIIPSGSATVVFKATVIA